MNKLACWVGTVGGLALAAVSVTAAPWGLGALMGALAAGAGIAGLAS